MFIAGVCVTFAMNGRRLAGALKGPYAIDGQVAEAWARIGDEASDPVLRVSIDNAIIPIREEVVDPHPEELRDAETGEVQPEYRLPAGTRVVALARRLPDDTYGVPTEGPRLFAAGKAADIAANARRASQRMARNAVRAGGTGALLLLVGLFLR